jgi:hypothetical protein
VAATTQEEILSGILPRVSIEKITLSNRSNSLEVNVELNIKEVLDNNFFGSWFDDINIKKYILIDVIQSTDPKVTESLSFSNDMIQLCNLSRGKKSKDDLKIKAFSYLTGKNNLSELLQILESKTTRKVISLSEDSAKNNNIKNYPSYTNSDGEKVYEISYKTKFTLLNKIEPEHLAYFAVCSIDLQKLCSDLKIDYDIAESFEENGKVVSEIVIENSKIAGYSYVYVDGNGVAWSGPVHQNEAGEWRSGDDETANSITLAKISVSNTKIQDFRNFAEIQRMFLDFNQQYQKEGQPIKNSFNLENTLKQFTKIQSVDYKPNEKVSQFSSMFSSVDSDGNVKFLFGVDFVNLLKSYSKFSKLYDSNNQTFKNETISNTKILDLKVYRRRIKNNISLKNSVAKLNLEKLNNEEPDDLILQTRDESWKNFINSNNQKAGIRETELFMADDSDFVRYFTGIDKTFKNLTDGIYQYYVEIEIEDGVTDVVKEQLLNLSLAKNQLTEYYNKISKPTMRKFLIESQDPHIDSPQETSNNSAITDYGYDIVLNKLSPQLVSRLIKEYGGTNSISAPWVTSVAIFSTALDVFSESIQTDDDRTKIINFLSTNLMPNSTNPSIVSKIIELIDYFISSISKTFDIDLENTSDVSLVSPISSKTNKSFKITNFFDEIFDSNSLKTYNIDYLSTTQNVSSNDDGLTLLDRDVMDERVSNEMLKFFTTQTPTINFSDAADDPQNIKYSFLSPTRLDFRNRTVVFSGVQQTEQNAVSRAVVQSTQNRVIENFYNLPNKYDKAISMYADILNFKLDVNGKNRELISPIQQERQNLSQNERAKLSIREQVVVSKKINNLFSNFASLTIERFKVSDSAVLLGNTNIKSLNNLMSSLSSGAIRSNQSNNRSYTTTSANSIANIISNSEFDYVKNLSTININNVKIINGQVIGFNNKKTFSVSKLNKIPNQIRALIFKPQSQLSANIINDLSYTDVYSKYINNKTINYFNFEMLAEVQYLSGFHKIKGTNNLNLNNPIWKTLDRQYIDSISGDKEILCRLKSFSNFDLRIRPSSEMEKRFYDKYFIIKTSKLNQRPEITRGIIFTNPLIDNLIDSLRQGFPGIRIRESSSPSLPSLSMVPSNLEIIRTDSFGNRQTTNIRDIRDIVAKDIDKNVNIKIGKPITPAIAFAAVHATSLSVQESNINNNFKSSNHIPNRNISPRTNSRATTGINQRRSRNTRM